MNKGIGYLTFSVAHGKIILGLLQVHVLEMILIQRHDQEMAVRTPI
jgi:hypothetical protein